MDRPGMIRNKVLRETRAEGIFKHGAEEGVDGEADWNRQLETSRDTAWRWSGRQVTERKAMIKKCFFFTYTLTH